MHHPIVTLPYPQALLFQWDAMKHAQATAYSNGAALKRHCENAHHGVYQPSCPACQEIKARETVCSHK
jgi:hypothetical protein